MLHVRTDDPKGLLAAIKKLIDEKKIDTWSYDKDGDLRYEVEQYRKQVFGLKTSIAAGTLDLTVLGNKDVSAPTQAIQAIVYGRVAEQILAHFSKTHFSNVACNPLA